MKTVIISFLIFGLFNSSEMWAAGKQVGGHRAAAASPALAPADAQKAFKVPDGFQVRLFASEPDVVNPVAMTWDDRGRLWVVELYEYPLGAAPGEKPRDRIKILEDTDNDGRADKVTVFADGLNLATAILFGDGGVYVGQAPDLLFLKDTNGDDVADERKVVMTGFGLHDRHELLNGFTWGPDGWLYMTHGVFTHSTVRIPEATDDGVVMDAAVARFHPRTKKFEIYADGTSNPWGVDFDKYGNAFVSACVIDHLYHMAPGGIYQRQGGTPGHPYAYELLPSIVDHKHHMAAYCGINIYQGNNFPAEYQGRVFFGNIHQNAINHDRLIPNGSSFKAEAEEDFLTTSDGWFRPVVQNVGPDGALWVADWYDKYPCYQNAQADPEGVDRAYGRIWRVVYNGKDSGKKIGSRPERKMDLAKLKNEDLVNLLEHPNVWHRRSAQRLLSERSDRKGAMPDDFGLLLIRGLDGKTDQSLKKLLGHAQPETRLAAFWTLHGIGRTYWLGIGDDGKRESNKFHEETLRHSDPQLRAWAVRFAAQEIRLLDKAATNVVAQEEWRRNAVNKSTNLVKLLEFLAADTDPRVRLAVATAVRQLVSSSLTINTDINTNVPVTKILATLIKSSADAKDPLIPFMIWMASEPLVAANPEPGLKWLAENGANTMPLSGILARKSMRRICDTQEPAKLDKAVAFLTAIADKNDALTAAALEGLIEGQRAKPLTPTADALPLFEKLNAREHAQIKERTQQLSALWGDAAAISRTVKIINDKNASLDERLKAVEAARQFKNDTAREAIFQLIFSDASEPLVQAGLRSLPFIGVENLGTRVVKGWKQLSPASRRVAAEVLVTWWQWTGALLNGLEDKVIAPEDISANVLRSIAKFDNVNFDARLEQFFGRYRESDADKLKLIAEKKKVALTGEPNFKNGYEVAKRTCYVCHKMLGEGADVGPDLTGVGRSTLDALLANIIDPNQIIGKGYENVEIETKDDRSLSGRMVENSAAHVKLVTAGPAEYVIAKSDIASMKISERSVMPEGLEQLPDQDFRDLIWFILAPPEEGSLTPEKRKALVGN